MPTSPTPDDLLALARFCWPDREWTSCPIGARTRRRLDATMDAHWSAGKRDHVSAAEAVLIERGLGIRYIRQLAKALRFVPAPDGHRYSETDAMILATAPLDARVRAMVEVVRQHEHARGNSAKGETKETP